MSRIPSDVSIAELEAHLAQKRSQLEDLIHRKLQVQKQLKEIDVEIQRGVDFQTPIRRIGRPRNTNHQPPLRTFVRRALEKNKKGLTLAELVSNVQESGYNSTSANFKIIVYQCVYHSTEFDHDPDTGLYRIKK